VFRARERRTAADDADSLHDIERLQVADDDDRRLGPVAGLPSPSVRRFGSSAL